MNKKFTKLMAALALLTFLAVPMGMWGQTRDEVTTTFKAGSNYSAGMTLPYETGGLEWVTSAKPAGFESASPSRGIQYSKVSTDITTTIANATITKVEVVASTNGTANANSISVYVGNTQIGSTQSMPKENNKTYTFEDAGKTGEIKVTMYNAGGDSGKSTYIKSIAVTYTSGSTTYTVTYNANGGTGTLTDPNSPYQPNATVTVLANTFTKTGHSFAYWTTDQEGNDGPYEAGDEYPITANTTFYAQWSLNQYNVAIEVVDNVDLHADMLGEGEYDDIDYGTEITLSYDNLSSGYAFSSWVITKNEDGSNVTSQVLNGSTLTVPDYNITISATLIQVYTVNFNLNNGTFVANTDFPSDIVEKPAGTYTLPSATRSGYSFTGWSDGENTYSSGASYTVSGDVDFEAQWEESSEMELTFDLTSNPGGWPTTNSTTLENYTYTLSGVDYTFALKNVKCNSGYLMMTSTAVLGLPAIEGYKLTKVVASNSGGCSTSTQVGISSSASSANYIAGGSAQTWSTTGSQYTYTLTSTEENTMYYMYVTNKNAQVTSLALTYQAVGSTPAPQEYTLEVTSISNAEIYVFDATDPDETNWVYLFEGIDEVQVLEGTQIALSVVADEGYTIETLMVNNVDHAADITSGGTYTFNMPAENVTITVTTEEIVAPVGVNYVRITSLDQLTDGSKVIIAARYEEGLTNGYYAMPGETSGKPNGVEFTSVTSGDDQFLPAVITSSEDDYYWTVNVTNDGYTFTNAEDKLIGYGTSGTDFTTGGSNIEWTISRETAESTAMVGGYTGFVIRNGNTDSRAFAFNGTAFGPYSTQNMDKSGYNFFLDFFVQPATETYTLTIAGYGTSTTEGWHLIASPVAVDPASVEGMVVEDTDDNYESFDLYYFDQTGGDNGKEWKNYKANSFNLVPGSGYLYANKGNVNNTPNTVTLTFTGVPYSGDGEIELVYSTVNSDSKMHGWNLIGNPFSTAATLNLPFFKMNGTGSGFTSQNANSSVAAMEGVLVYAYDDDASQPISTATFTAAGRSNSESAAMVNIDVVSSFGDVMDNAIVNFNEGIQLPKFYFGTQNANIYIPQNGKEYAIVSAEAQGEMPVNFKAAENGTYTLTVNPEGVEMNYLHLIDNMTGADIDLLAATSTGSVATYTFNASTTDYSSRFRLVFAANNEDGVSTGSTAFAFYSNGTWVINNTGEATLQVVDVNGRILSSETVNGSVSKAINAPAGVYMLRLINGNDVKTQKIVVR